MKVRSVSRFASSVSSIALLSASLVFSVSVDPASASTPTACLTQFSPIEPVADGDGIRTISTENHLTWIASSETLGAPALSAHLVLANDLNLQGCLWPGAYQPGGVDRATRQTIPEGFSGIFDGNGHTISGLLIRTGPEIFDEMDQTAMGFFKVVNGSASVRNVSFASPRLDILSESSGQIPSHYALGIVVGAFGQENTASPTLSNVSVTDASVTMDCDVTTGCQVSTVGGVVGSVSRGTVNGVNVTGSMSFVDSSQPVVVGGDGKELYVAPGSSSVTTVGMFAGGLYESATASDISATGSISATVEANTIGGIVGEISDAALSRAESNVSITIGSPDTDLPTQVENVTNIGGAVGSIDFNTPSVDSVSSSGAITIRVAGFPENSPATQTISRIGGLFGRVDDFASVADARTTGSLTISARDLGNTEADIRMSRVGGAVGEAGETGGPSVLRMLALGDLSITADSSVTTGFIGALFGFADMSVAASGFWDSSADTVPTSAAGAAKTPAELSLRETYLNWSMVTTWVDSWSDGDPVWGLCEGTEDARPFLQWAASEDPCAEPTPPTEAAIERPAPRESSSRGWFTLGPVTLGFPAIVGEQATGTPVAASGRGMRVGSTVDMVVRSTPVTLARVGVGETGRFSASGSLPQLSAGNHRLLIDGYDASGLPWIITVGFAVDSAGVFTWVGEPTLTNPPQLARTGVSWTPGVALSLGTVFVLSGILMLRSSRQIPTRH